MFEIIHYIERRNAVQTMYVIISNLFIKEVSVIRREGDMCLIRFMDSDAGIRIRASRLYETEAEAMKKLPKKTVKNSLGPWAYWH